MSKRKKKRSERRYDGRRLRDPNLWKPGEPLTKEDEELLSELKQKYKELGRIPSKRSVSNYRAVKKRFRIWSEALMAAGLLPEDDAKQKKKIKCIQSK